MSAVAARRYLRFSALALYLCALVTSSVIHNHPYSNRGCRRSPLGTGCRQFSGPCDLPALSGVVTIGSERPACGTVAGCALDPSLASLHHAFSGEKLFVLHGAYCPSCDFLALKSLSPFPTQSPCEAGPVGLARGVEYCPPASRPVVFGWARAPPVLPS
jgi:hypothetical protein